MTTALCVHSPLNRAFSASLKTKFCLTSKFQQQCCRAGQKINTTSNSWWYEIQYLLGFHCLVCEWESSNTNCELFFFYGLYIYWYWGICFECHYLGLLHNAESNLVIYVVSQLNFLTMIIYKCIHTYDIAHCFCDVKLYKISFIHWRLECGTLKYEWMTVRFKHLPNKFTQCW